jgi:hypothetical protein
MSAALYSRRLYWDDRQGIARANGVTVELHAKPPIEPILRHMSEIDYTPEVRVARVRERSDAWRDLAGDEVRAVEQWLELVTRSALVAAQQPLKA